MVENWMKRLIFGWEREWRKISIEIGGGAFVCVWAVNNLWSDLVKVFWELIDKNNKRGRQIVGAGAFGTKGSSYIFEVVYNEIFILGCYGWYHNRFCVNFSYKTENITSNCKMATVQLEIENKLNIFRLDSQLFNALKIFRHIVC